MISRYIYSLANLYSYIIMARLILSWIPSVNYRHPAVTFLINITEPVLAPARRIIPSIGGLDLSPILVFWLLPIVGGILQGLFASLGL